MMKYFENKHGIIFGYDEDQIKAGYPIEPMRPLSDAEAKQHETPAPPTREEIERARLIAYADPITGSDRYFAEAMRESNADIAAVAKSRGMSRYAEIQAAYPWPKDEK